MDLPWTKQAIFTGDEIQKRSYSRMMRAGPLLFISGVGGRDISKDRRPELIEETGYPLYFEEQARLVLKRLALYCEQAGTSLKNTLWMTGYFLHPEDIDRWHKILEELSPFGDNGAPASSLVVVKRLHRKVMLLEVDAIVLIPEPA